MKGYIFNKRFLVQEKLTEGAYGLIYKGVDLMTPFHKAEGINLSLDNERALLNSNGALIYQPVIFKFT